MTIETLNEIKSDASSLRTSLLDVGFVREERYIVVKLKNLDDADEHNLRGYLEENSVDTTSCVVVENNWPECVKVWSMIEQRVEEEL